MSNNFLGVTFALIALFSWGFGDFFIQRSTRVIGVWKSLFYNDLIAIFLITPFVYKELGNLNFNNIALFLLISIVGIFAALFDFTALKQGKIAIVEPLLGIELPITVILGLTIAHEKLTIIQLILIALVFIGVLLAITSRNKNNYRHRVFERGVIFAGLGAIAMAFINFLVGVSSQTSSPLMTIWFFSVIPAIICSIYLGLKGELKTFKSDFKNHFKVIFKQSVVDNLAWVAYAFSTTYIPIAIATTISESYIAIAVFLGIFVNREKLRPYQVVGVILAIIGVITLSLNS